MPGEARFPNSSAKSSFSKFPLQFTVTIVTPSFFKLIASAWEPSKKVKLQNWFGLKKITDPSGLAKSNTTCFVSFLAGEFLRTALTALNPMLIFSAGWSEGWREHNKQNKSFASLHELRSLHTSASLLFVMSATRELWPVILETENSRLILVTTAAAFNRERSISRLWQQSLWAKLSHLVEAGWITSLYWHPVVYHNHYLQPNSTIHTGTLSIRIRINNSRNWHC